ncbi:MULTISPECIES: NUDIX hydrolase [Thermoactinomyces]|uniref:NUDIX hydrolase n=1 Tax=Thermoactinomyces daqus TaxID=1329516 RepID=A0A7W1XBM0_9BACL|nr:MULTISPECIES: NUDIX hydrolase [Thermoactinomyces]MBA4543677.1 NUDIX hydrolase [Thermoactinomyces daqus]MBH8597128.1 NUDIX hydrolase [Thermoactinomyces sp. CICC 10523]MBH8602688.1 NUDIX hydrolase [Thermoactinomyces sp. CICC 10522]MBH8606201.1 NUDIX hydrolase [Thermoactinomyces sp. CICC 10521]
MASPKHVLAAYAVVLNYDAEILLVKHPKRGWELPGGLVEEKESIRLSVIRQVKEETGIHIKLVKYCGIFQNPRSGICNFLFRGKPIGGRITIDENNEIEDADYFPIETAMRLVSWRNMKQRIFYCLDEKKHPFFVEF